MLTLTRPLLDFFNLETLGAYLRTREMLLVDGVLVDVDAIMRGRYACDTMCCVHCEQREGTGVVFDGDCCLGAEIRLTPAEQEGLVAALPAILPYMAPAARAQVERLLQRHPSDPGKALWRAVRVNGRPTGHVALRRQADGACLFRFTGYDDGRPFARCAIHAYLLNAGRPLWDVKPMTCWVWPLALVPLYDGRLLLTLHTPDTHMFTGESRYHATRPCLQRTSSEAVPVYRTLEPELRHLFGDDFYEHLLAAIAVKEGGA
ncbi:MAG: hypothetical protein ACUVX9_05260 [Anaerolineae bacterium]